MGGINSTIEERRAKKLKRYLSKHKDTNSYQNTCISYNPRKATDYMRRLDRPLWFLTAIDEIVDAQKEEGLKFLLKATRKSCICIRSIPIIRAINTGNLESLQVLLDNGGETNPVISLKYVPNYCTEFSCSFIRNDGEETYMEFVPLWMMIYRRCHYLPYKGPEILMCIVNAHLIENINILGSEISGYFDRIMHLLVWMKVYVGSELLDVLFRNACRLDMLSQALRNALQEGHVNYVIWLVRHGAFTRSISKYEDPYMTSMVMHKIYRNYCAVEIIFHSGTTVINRSDSYSGDHRRIWQKQNHFTYEGQLEGIHKDPERREAYEASHVYRQASDLQEFSDESLNIYPEPHLMTGDQCLQRIIDFISQPAPLKWLCRRKLRRNMISHCPSAVNSLPLPKPLKRYIMCHGVYW